MPKIQENLKKLIALLNSHSVKYQLGGGYAVAYHGHPRMTGDCGFFVEASRENAGKLEAVLGAFGFGSMGLAAKDSLGPGTIVQLGYPPNRIDILTSISGVDSRRHGIGGFATSSKD